VEAVGLTNGLPLTPVYGTSFYDADQAVLTRHVPGRGHSHRRRRILQRDEIPVVRGRTFDATDTPDGRVVAVVNKYLAKQIWGDADPLGHRLQVSWGTNESSPRSSASW
jgi:hypothetical protein